MHLAKAGFCVDNGNMKKIIALSIASFFALSSCSENTTSSYTSNDVIGSLEELGALEVKDITSEEMGMMKAPFKQRFSFILESVKPKGAQLFICENKADGDAIFTYYDALKAFGGTNLFQSKDGKLVLQMNSEVEKEEAEKFKAKIEGFR